MTAMVLLALTALAADREFAPDQNKLPAPPPKGAVALLNDRGNHSFVSMAGEKMNWPVKDGVIVSTPKGNRNHIVSKLHFRDADIHVEFLLPEEGTGNSGVYIHGHYVSERSKPASHGRLKTSHFEERQMESLTSWVHPAPREVGDGESAQSGHGRDDSFAA